MKKRVLLFLVVSFVINITSIFGSGNEENSELNRTITVFNAASTTDLMNEIGDLFYKETMIQVNFNPSASGTLARQLEQGADADVFISASKKWMTYVDELELSKIDTPFVRNKLVLVSPLESDITSFTISSDLDFLNIFEGRLSIGDPEFVPAGAYAKEALDFYGWYTGLEKRILPGADVRAALSVVELGEVDLGIVYSSDAGKSNKVKVVGEFPIESHTPVEYYCSFLNSGSLEGKEFYDFLISNPEVFKLYEKYGFEPIE